MIKTTLCALLYLFVLSCPVSADDYWDARELRDDPWARLKQDYRERDRSLFEDEEREERDWYSHRDADKDDKYGTLKNKTRNDLYNGMGQEHTTSQDVFDHMMSPHSRR